MRNNIIVPCFLFAISRENVMCAASLVITSSLWRRVGYIDKSSSLVPQYYALSLFLSRNRYIGKYQIVLSVSSQHALFQSILSFFIFSASFLSKILLKSKKKSAPFSFLFSPYLIFHVCLQGGIKALRSIIRKEKKTLISICVHTDGSDESQRVEQRHGKSPRLTDRVVLLQHNPAQSVNDLGLVVPHLGPG